MINITHLNKIANKVIRLQEQYSEFLIEDSEEIPCQIYETEHHYNSPPSDAKYKKIISGDSWGKPFSYAWFSGDIAIPSKFIGRDVYLDCQNGAVENLIFIGEKPVGMTDDVLGGRDAIFRQHRYFYISDMVENKAKLHLEGYASHTFYGTMPYEKKQTFALNAFCENRTYVGVKLVVMRSEVSLFIDYLARLTSAFKAVENDGFNAGEILNVFEQVFCVVNQMPQDGYDGDSLVTANEIMQRYFNLHKRQKTDGGQIGLVGHSHLDTAWLWTVEETKHKAARTAANALTQLRRYPEYKFMMSSILYLDWFKRDYPEIFKGIIEQHARGAFEFNGAAWVECDCNLVGSESLARQFVKGQRYMRQHLGKVCDCFWLPDTFGYSAALPQIMRSANVKYFLTTKISWNDTNKFPYDTFLWRGIDGSEVLSHFNTTHEYPLPELIATRANKLQNKHLTSKGLIAYGFGDGGGGPSAKMVESTIACEQFDMIPSCSHTTVSDFMHSLEGTAELPKYSGELYLELHRGTLTTNHDLKKNNRRLEIALHNLELVAALSGKQIKPQIDRLYDMLLLNQFHDILPGTCITEVNALAKQQNIQAIYDAEQLTREMLGQGDNYFNVLPFSYKGYVDICDKMSNCCSYTDFDGNQRSIAYVDIAPFGVGQVVSPPSQQFVFDGSTLITPLLKVEFDKSMRISKLYDLETDRQLAKGLFNELKIGQDVPNLWDNWDIDADYELKQQSVTQLVSSQVILDSGSCYKIRNSYQLTGQSVLVQDMTFYADNKRIDFITRAQWKDKHKLLKVYFDTNIMSNIYRSEIQFGYVERPTTRNTAVEQAKFECCNHKWTDLSEVGYGVALLNDCKYGVSCEEGRLSLSLIKSGTHPDTTADEGVHSFTYSLYPHTGGFSFDNVILPSYLLNYQPQRCGNINFANNISISTPSVIIETVKPSEEGADIVLRLYESEGTARKAQLRLSGRYDVYITNLLEDDIEKLEISNDCCTLRFSPFEIKTIKLIKR